MVENKRQNRLEARRKKERQGRLRTMGIIGIIAVAVVGVLIWNNFRPGPATPQRNHPQENGTRLGDPNAPIVIEEFADFLCSHCRDFFVDTSEQIIEQYVATGDVFYVFHALPFQGVPSQTAAEASYCAADQGRFWDFHDNLFFTYGTNLTDSGMVRRARDLGLDVGTFRDCLSSGAKSDLMLENLDYARSLGVEGTPAFVINGQLALTGAQPFSAFQQTIESLLAESN